MSEGLNKVMLIGNLGADPELKYTQGGQAVLKLRLACTERYVDKSGERKDRTEWVSVVMWGNRAEALGKILQKGRPLYIEGRLQTSSWDDKDGNKRFKTEINAHHVLLLGGRGQGDEREQSREGESRGGRNGSAPKHTERTAQSGADNFGDDDIPFAIPFTTAV
jgi:single-strand DNA-binding protein